MDLVRNIIGAIGQIIQFCIGHPIVPLIVVGIVVIALIARAVYLGRPIVTDDQRMFSGPQKAEAKRLAGGRCEHSYLGFRCRKPGAHADHIYPWSKGGATAMSNCQSLCEHHNLQKSNHIPSRFYIRRLQVRRRRYFPAGVSPRVEWRIGVAS